MNPKDNLYKPLDIWDEIKNEISKGQGNELKNKEGRIKFCALHSSSALCVNNFANFKKHHKEVSFFGYSGFTEAVFEKKLPTRISTPNIDFYLENHNTIIGIESKFTEYLKAKFDYTKGNLCKYFMREELNYLPYSFGSTILNYINTAKPMHLDVAQLIKHSIGLLNNKGNKDAVLVYIYWKPKSWSQKGEYQKIYEQHQYELEEFSQRINKFITFKYISYLEFWNDYEKIWDEDVSKIREKYELEL